MLGVAPPVEVMGDVAPTDVTGPVGEIFCVKLRNQFSQIGLNAVLPVLGSVRRSSAHVGGGWNWLIVTPRLVEVLPPVVEMLC
jgi:hypothetical protein